MAVSIDTTSSANGSVGVTSISWSHTVASDANCLYVLISLDGAGGTYSYDASATYNGTSMTRVHQGNTNQYLAVFRLLSPTTGTNTVQVSWTGSTFPSSAAISLKGVATGTPEGTVSSSTNSSGSSYSHTITSGGNDLILTFGSINNNTSATATGSATSQVQSTAGAAYTLGAIGSASGGTSVSVGFSWSSANRYSGASFSVAAASTTYNDTISDAVTASDGIASALTVSGAISDNATASDVMVGANTVSGAITANVTASDTMDGEISSDVADTHDGFRRRSRRERALDAAAERERQEWIAERNALRLSLEAAMGYAAEVVEDAPPAAVEAVEAAQEAAAFVAPVLARRVADVAALAEAHALVARLHAAIEEAARMKALAEDDEEVLMLLRAL